MTSSDARLEEKENGAPASSAAGHNVTALFAAWCLGVLYMHALGLTTGTTPRMYSIDILTIARYGIWTLPIGAYALFFISRRTSAPNVPRFEFSHLAWCLTGCMLAYIVLAIAFHKSESLAISFLLQFTGVVWLMSAARMPPQALFPENEAGWRRAALVAALAAFLMLACLSLTALIGALLFPDRFRAMSFSTAEIDWNRELIEILFKVLLIPVCEETIFRAGLIGRLKPAFGAAAAVLISAAVFSALHMQGEILWARLIAGIFLGALYVRTGNIAAPVLLHAIANAGITFVPLIFGK